MHIWSIKGVYFLQNANNLNLKLPFRLYTWPTKRVFCLSFGFCPNEGECSLNWTFIFRFILHAAEKFSFCASWDHQFVWLRNCTVCKKRASNCYEPASDIKSSLRCALGCFNFLGGFRHRCSACAFGWAKLGFMTNFKLKTMHFWGRQKW